ncbi:uncharacterized protein LOC128216069 [Mya arenaria]|uniref:uncharacterized protein LOC128216069 n=1 Tax=Mya arenaria TaxID=6604 RepID=UPI0022E44490|nr:uncharacterized protein LOC128216069 [Mya arenaria]
MGGRHARYVSAPTTTLTVKSSCQVRIRAGNTGLWEAVMSGTIRAGNNALCEAIMSGTYPRRQHRSMGGRHVRYVSAPATTLYVRPSCQVRIRAGNNALCEGFMSGTKTHIHDIETIEPELRARTMLYQSVLSIIWTLLPVCLALPTRPPTPQTPPTPPTTTTEPTTTLGGPYLPPGACFENNHLYYNGETIDTDPYNCYGSVCQDGGVLNWDAKCFFYTPPCDGTSERVLGKCCPVCHTTVTPPTTTPPPTPAGPVVG